MNSEGVTRKVPGIRGGGDSLSETSLETRILKYRKKSLFET